MTLQNNNDQEAISIVLRTSDGTHTLDSFHIREDNDNENGLRELVTTSKPIGKEAVLYVGNIASTRTDEKI